MAAPSTSTFATVLVARKPQEQPSELELKLRQEASKCRVVERLSGGADVLFPGSETTIALRTYYPSHLAQLEPKDDENDSSMLNRGSKAAPRNKDGLEAFRNAFKYPLVFFILPPQLMMDQLSRPDSFVNMAQLIMNESKPGKDSKAGNAKTFVVPDTKSVVDTVLILLDALKPERRKMREKYYEHTRLLHFLPDSKGHVSDPDNQIATHVSTEIRSLATRLKLGAGEVEIMMRRLGSLQKIATADHHALADLPLDDASKEKLHDFFGTKTNLEEQRQQHPAPNPTYSPTTAAAAAAQQHDIAYVPTSNAINNQIDENLFDSMPNYNDFMNEQSQNQFRQQDNHNHSDQFMTGAVENHQFDPQNHQFESQNHQFESQNHCSEQYQFAGQGQFEQQVVAPFQGHAPQQQLHQYASRTMASRPPFMQQHHQAGPYQGNNIMMEPQDMSHSYRPTSQWTQPPPSDRPYSQARQHYTQTSRPFSRFTHAPHQQQRYPPSITRKFSRSQHAPINSAMGQYFG